MYLQPGSINVNIIQYDSKDYAEIILDQNDMCRVSIDYPYSKMNYFMANNKITLPVASSHTTFVPLSFKYECKFLIFHKMGNKLLYAQIN